LGRAGGDGGSIALTHAKGDTNWRKGSEERWCGLYRLWRSKEFEGVGMEEFMSNNDLYQRVGSDLKDLGAFRAVWDGKR